MRRSCTSGLGHAGKAEGRWHLYAFAGAPDLRDERQGVLALCRFLQESPDSPMLRQTAAGQDVDAMFDVRAVFRQSHQQIDIHTLPALLLPPKGRNQLRDYEKVFSSQLRHAPDIFELRGVDRARGALVVVGPDQYVAHVLPLSAHQALAEFFSCFLVGACRPR
jgi:phenol 2-monooxygenase/3-hydroxybenzoate 4-monooxygenase